MRFPRSIRFLLIGFFLVAISGACFAQIAISVRFGPPALPYYQQPPLPAEGYIWTPGYWAYSDQGYYWVPGTWVEPPEQGLLWTPGYWAFNDGLYFWNAGYWGPQVGYYGGIPYGFGYFGRGYEGGYWQGGRFFYNRSVNNIDVVRVRNINVYTKTVVKTTNVTRISYNGGPGGIKVRPTAEEEKVTQERHVPPTAVQTQHVDAAKNDRTQWASVNHGRPDVAATPKPGQLSGGGVVKASRAGGAYHAPAEAAKEPGRANASADRNAPAARPDNNAPHHEETQPNHPAPRPDVPRPPKPSRPENTPRPEAAPRPEPPSHPDAHPDNARRPEPRPDTAPPQRNAPEAQREARPERPPEPQMHQEKPPQPQKEARPEKPEHKEDPHPPAGDEKPH